MRTLTLREFDSRLEKIEELAAQERDAEVIDLCSELAVAAPTRFEPYYHRAQAQLAVGNKMAAFEDISKAIALQPKEPALFFFRGSWNLDAGRICESVADLSRAIELEENLGSEYYVESARFALAVASLLVGDHDRALEECSLVRSDMTSFVAGRLWRAEEVKQQARLRRGSSC